MRPTTFTVAVSAAALSTCVVEAFKPTLFFNYTLSPFDGLIEWVPQFADKQTYYGGIWVDEMTESGQAARRGILPPNANSSSDNRCWLELNAGMINIWIHGTANAPVDGGLNRYHTPTISYESDTDRLGSHYVNNTGPFVAHLSWPELGKRRIEVHLRSGDKYNGTSEVVIEKFDLTMGMETTA